jgi:hypothetical protein
MPDQHFKLGYKSPEQFMQEVNPAELLQGDRVAVRLKGGTNYHFTYWTTVDGDIKGRSALNGHQVSINAVDMVLTEKDDDDN